MAYVDALKDAVFQPALPMRGVTREHGAQQVIALISTRTPHAGSDPAWLIWIFDLINFNPHSPCGE